MNRKLQGLLDQNEEFEKLKSIFDKLTSMLALKSAINLPDEERLLIKDVFGTPLPNKDRTDRGDKNL